MLYKNKKQQIQRSFVYYINIFNVVRTKLLLEIINKNNFTLYMLKLETKTQKKLKIGFKIVKLLNSFL